MIRIDGCGESFRHFGCCEGGAKERIELERQSHSEEIFLIDYCDYPLIRGPWNKIYCHRNISRITDDRSIDESIAIGTVIVSNGVREVKSSDININCVQNKNALIRCDVSLTSTGAIGII